MDYAKRGAAALEISDASTALDCYTQALIEHPHSPDYFIQRSIAFTRLKPPRHDLALQDAEFAVILGQKRAKREKIQAAQHRRVVSLYGLGRYVDAKYVLGTMERWRAKENKKDIMEGDMWKARIATKLKDTSEAEQTPSIKEYPELELPEPESLRQILKAQLNSDGSYQFGEADISYKAKETASDKTDQPSVSSLPPISAAKIRHEWYQNPESVILTLYVKGISKEKAQIDISDDSIFISFPHPSNTSSDYTFSIDPLYASVDVSSSKWSIMSTKVEVVLKKRVTGQKWHSLEGSEDRPKESAPMKPQKPVNTSTAAPSYPTSSRSGPKDWDKLAKDLTAKKSSKKSKEKTKSTSGSEDEGVDSDFDSGDPVDSFFKKLYAGSDPDTRRAMMKSFQESDGTTLSTNWSEVGKGKVEPYKSKSND